MTKLVTRESHNRMQIGIAFSLAKVMLAALILGLAPALQALEVKVSDMSGEALEDAVVFITQRNGKTLQPKAQDQMVIDQQDKEFIPFVTALVKGSSVIFPNNDNIRHQVYSFSKAKNFEIPLYKGNPDRPILFDKAGVVALGCNIHDWMSAYIFVSESPYLALTDAQGMATLEQAPDGELEIQVWHPRLKGETTDTAKRIQSPKQNQLSVQIETRRLWRAFRSPTGSGSGGYN